MEGDDIQGSASRAAVRRRGQRAAGRTDTWLLTHREEAAGSPRALLEKPSVLAAA